MSCLLTLCVPVPSAHGSPQHSNGQLTTKITPQVPESLLILGLTTCLEVRCEVRMSRALSGAYAPLKGLREGLLRLLPYFQKNLAELELVNKLPE